MLRRTLSLLVALLLVGCVLPTAPSGPPVGPPPVSPLIPNQVPVLLENQWRLTEISHNGTRYEFDAIEPVLVTFSPGSLTYRACNAGSMYFDTTGTEVPNEYRLRYGASTAEGCPGVGGEQQGDFVNALIDTTRYEIEDDTLILSGENTRLTFVIDNEATKPPD